MDLAYVDRFIVPLAMLLGLTVSQPALAQQSCEALTSLKLPSTTITSASFRPETTYAGIAPLGLATGARIPARCEVTGVIGPTPDSTTQFAVWLPATGWNGKYRQEGNGGWAGVVPYWNMIDPLRRGYATAGTDNGHDASPGAVSGAFAITRPICPYPAVARYKGSGDVNDAANFVCGPQLQGVPIGAVASVTGLPFTNGRFEGTGRWINQQAEGDYTVTYSITDNGDGGKRHAVRRLFRKPDGSSAAEENTTVILTPTTRNRMRVSIATVNGTVEGLGYCLGNQCHYEAMLSSDEQMEFTFTAAGSRVDGLASSTNKGNFTIWRETSYAR